VLLLSHELFRSVVVAETLHARGLIFDTSTVVVGLANATGPLAGVFFALAPVVESEELAAHVGRFLILSFFFGV
jgi:hypothetical protein